MSKTTSSGLVKNLSTNKKAILLSSEIFDIVYKLLKSDDDNATGDVQLLCKLFSGERSTYHYSTENCRVIDQNTPFCILGSTQLKKAAKLIALMDQGHGLIDRYIVATPLAYRPTLSEMEEANNFLSTEIVCDFQEICNRIHEIEKESIFEFSRDAKAQLRETIHEFVTEVNEAIKEGRVPPKSKSPELIPRMAAALHVFNHVTHEVYFAQTPTSPSRTITKETLEKASAFVKYLECQKDILCQVFILNMQIFINIIWYLHLQFLIHFFNNLGY